MRIMWPVIGVIIAAVIASAAFFIGIQQTGPPASQGTTATAETRTTAPPTSRGVVSLTLYLNDYGYNASKGGPTITAYVGDLIRIRLVGNGSGPIRHDFTLDRESPSPYDIQSDRLRNGEEQVIEFVANHEGEYKYYCSVKPPFGQSHRERGQEGTIIILPRS
ncbi:Copper-containing nitrite reductase [Candidatus Calditenuaceae archaeon HR02]|nr:Copper-containing nitrite reductase [Candidatus Calditenuaceae archaeon HR02]